MNKPITDMQHPKMLLDPYVAWAAKEGVPITEDFGVDLLKVPTAPWPRFGVDGGIVHLKGRGDFVSIFVLDLTPGAKTAPQKHLFEEVVYVLVRPRHRPRSKRSDGRKHSFEWGPKSLFALPLNARYQHFNASGRERARLASTNNLCDDAQPLPQRGLRLRQRLRIPGAAGRGEILQRRRRVHPGAARPQHVGDEFHPRPRRLRAQAVGRARRRRLEHDVHPGRRHHARAHLADAGRHLQEGATATAPISTSSRSPATAIRCSGTRARRTSCASTGSTAWCSRRPTRCSTSTSTRRPIRRAISRSPSAACAIRSPPTSGTCSWAWT